MIFWEDDDHSEYYYFLRDCTRAASVFFTVSMLRLSPELRKTSEKRTKIPIFSPAYRPEIVINKGGIVIKGGYS